MADPRIRRLARPIPPPKSLTLALHSGMSFIALMRLLKMRVFEDN